MQIGNAWIDDKTGQLGIYDYFWTHALNSDETNAGIHKYCNFDDGDSSSTCDDYQSKWGEEAGGLDIYNIYAPTCKLSTPKSSPSGSVSLYASNKIVLTNNFNPIRLIKKLL